MADGDGSDGHTLWDEVRAMASGRTPFTSVYLPADPTQEGAAHRLDLEWRHLRDELVEQGTPDDVLGRVEALVLGERHGGTIAVVVDADGQSVERTLPEVEAGPLAIHGPLPHLAPLVAAAQANPPYVVALVDRRGADIVTVVDGTRIADDESVDGDPRAPITKVHAGGWSQRRIQQRAENTWEENAGSVAEEVAAAARRAHASVVIVAGDERAVALLQDHAPHDLAELLEVVDTGGRAVDGSADELQREVERVVATVHARRTRDVLARFVELRERRADVADGPGATFAALREALADEVLVHAGSDDRRTAWFEPTSHSLVASEARTLRDLGVEPVEAPLVDVVVWSALGTGASVQLVPGAGPNVPVEGLGAFLRGPLGHDA
jgi:hypothetical protein